MSLSLFDRKQELTALTNIEQQMTALRHGAYAMLDAPYYERLDLHLRDVSVVARSRVAKEHQDNAASRDDAAAARGKVSGILRTLSKEIENSRDDSEKIQLQRVYDFVDVALDLVTLPRNTIISDSRLNETRAEALKARHYHQFPM